MQAARKRKQWRPRDGAGESSVLGDPAAWAAKLGVGRLAAQLLLQRGIGEVETARRFLTPKLGDLHDPAQLPGADAAVQRLARAVREQQPIVIYGDYDVDGVAASAILWHTLTHAGGKAYCYVPHRIEEGYGLNTQAIRRIAEGEVCNGWSQDGPLSQTPAVRLPPGVKPLVISVDCGITAVEPASVARELGLDLIITDHHELDERHLPDALALAHPRLPGSKYPFGELCGAGVAFKIAWHFARHWCGSERVSDTYRRLLLDLLSLAALGTVADVVPLTGENRVVTVFGLGQIKRTGITGLNALIDASRLRDEKIDSYHVGFVLGPRLNACGRMGHAREAVHLLTSAGAEEARSISEYLCERNDARRTIERAIFEEAKQIVTDRGYDCDDLRVIVVGKDGWHQGVIGIVASRLVEEFGRPVVMLTFHDGQAHGSARSVPGFSIHEALASCAQRFISFGGHAMAAGMRLETGQVDDLRRDLVEFASSRIAPDQLTGVVEIDGECPPGALCVEAFDEIARLAPFGSGNPRPVFTLSRVRVSADPLRIGGGGKHLRLKVGVAGRTVWAVWFGAGDRAGEFAVGDTIDLAFEPQVSTWQGQRRIDIIVKDVRPSPR